MTEPVDNGNCADCVSSPVTREMAAEYYAARRQGWISEPTTEAGRALVAWAESDARPLDEFTEQGGSVRSLVVRAEAQARATGRSPE